MTRDSKTILVLDDSETVLELVRAELSELGHRVFAAGDLSEMERLCAAHSPDLVLLDVQMPEAFGDDVGMVLRRARGIVCPIYLLSSLDPHELEQRSRDAGIDGYISKREGMDHLVRRVREILG